MKLLYEIFKNLKIIFRNLSSLVMLVIGPLLLILILGFAFSADEPHDIKIGLVAEQESDLFSGVETISYLTSGDCVEELVRDKVDLCLEVSGDLEQDLPSLEIIFYYDNSKEKISKLIIDSLKESLGETGEQISISATRTILDNVQNVVVFINQKRGDLDVVVEEAFDIKREIITRNKRMIQIRETFLPAYNNAKDLQQRLNNLTAEVPEEEVDERINEAKEVLDEAERLFEEVKAELNEPVIVYTNATLTLVFDEELIPENVTVVGLPDNITIVDNTIDLTEIATVSLPGVDIPANQVVSIEDYSSTEQLYLVLAGAEGVLDEANTVSEFVEGYKAEAFAQVRDATGYVNEVILRLDEVKFLLDDEIAKSDEYLVKIDSGVEQIDEITMRLDEDIAKISGFSPDLAERIARPISKLFEPLLKELKGITALFPTLLAAVITFIALLFSNIVTLTEITSKAYYRNLIAPVNKAVFLSGLVFTNMLIVLFQVGILLVVAQWRFGINIVQNLLPVLIVSLLMIIVFSFIGMIFAFVFTNKQTSILVTTFTALIFLLFSDIVVPLKLMPPLATAIASWSPFVMGQKIFGKLLLYDITPIVGDLFGLVVVIVVLFIGLVLLFRFRNERLYR